MMAIWRGHCTRSSLLAGTTSLRPIWVDFTLIFFLDVNEHNGFFFFFLLGPFYSVLEDVKSPPLLGSTGVSFLISIVYLYCNRICSWK